MRNSSKRSIFDSFESHELTSEKENEVKREMKRMKSPYLKKIEQAKKHFQTAKKCFQSRHMNRYEENVEIKLEANHIEENLTSNQTTDRPLNDNQRIFTEQSNDDVYHNQQRSPNFREWTLQHHQKSLFNKKTDLLESYNRIFEKKVKSPKWQAKGESFKIQEKHIIERIYHQIGDTSDKTVTFSALIEFFKKCPLFYHIYNIHPNSLVNVINESAHRHQNKLTEQEFMNLFLLNNRTNLDYQNYNVEKIEKKCVVDEQTWKDLKEVFVIFDTFGNQTIQLRQFIQKIKISLPLKYLLQKQVLYFPSIQRSYNLKKIIFDIQHKLNMSESFIRWEDIKNLITNFNHVKQPTIDIIQRKYLAAGKITHFSNTFMLKDEIISFVKQAYNRSPKYCEHFVKLSHICDEIYDSTECKHYLPEIVRNNPQKVTFGQALLKLKAYQHQYLDLDQILEWFSIKDVSKEAEKSLLTKFDMIDSSESDDEVFDKERRQAYKKYRNIQNLPVRSVPNADHKQITKVQQFKLTKKREQTIRQRKVKQMIKQKQELQKREFEQKFKANSIPSSINHEKYLQYKEKMRKNKEVILSKLNHVSERDRFVLKYLEANTKLFQKPKTKEVQQQKYVFQPKPVPWFVQVNLLDKIQEDKQERIKENRRQIKKKYLRQWKNLPNFLQQMNIVSQVAINKDESQHALLKELDSKLKKTNVKQVPNFRQLHQKFQQQLQKKKNIFKPTIVKQFNLTSPKQSKQSSQIIPKECHLSISKSHMTESNNYIGSTIKYEAIVKLNQQKKQYQQLKIKQQKQANKQRKKNQKQFAKYMRKQLMKQFRKLNVDQQKPKALQKTKEFQKNHKKQVAQIYQRVFMRPFLFQSKSSHNKSGEILESRARPVQLNDESANKIYEIVSDLGSQRVDVGEAKKTQNEQLTNEIRNSY